MDITKQTVYRKLIRRSLYIKLPLLIFTISAYMGFILLISVILGSYISSKFVVRKDNPLSTKTIKYISAILGLIISIVFFYSAYYDKS